MFPLDLVAPQKKMYMCILYRQYHIQKFAFSEAALYIGKDIYTLVVHGNGIQEIYKQAS